MKSKYNLRLKIRYTLKKVGKFQINRKESLFKNRQKTVQIQGMVVVLCVLRHFRTGEEGIT